RHHLFPEQRSSPSGRPSPTFQQATREFQEELLRESLRETDWNVARTAERLDITRSHVYNLIHAFGLDKSSTKRNPTSPEQPRVIPRCSRRLVAWFRQSVEVDQGHVTPSAAPTLKEPLVDVSLNL